MIPTVLHCLTTPFVSFTNFAANGVFVVVRTPRECSALGRGERLPRAFSFFVCLPPFRQGGEVLFFLSVPCSCLAISDFYQKKKGRDFQDIAAQRPPLSARNTPRRSIAGALTRRHWRAGRARQEEKTQPRPPSASFAVASPTALRDDLHPKAQGPQPLQPPRYPSSHRREAACSSATSTTPSRPTPAAHLRFRAPLGA